MPNLGIQPKFRETVVGWLTVKIVTTWRRVRHGA